MPVAFGAEPTRLLPVLLAQLLALFPYQCEGPSAVRVSCGLLLSWSFGSSCSILHS